MQRVLLVLLVCLLAFGWGMPTAQAQDPCPTEDTPGCTHGLPTETYNALLAEMQAYPEPVVTAIPIDQEQVNAYTFYRVLEGAQRYDAPNGSVIGSMGDGFNFVSIYAVQDGFARMRDGTWLPLTSLKKTFASAFSGVRFEQPLKYPMAWIIQATIPARVPGGVMRAEWPAVNRYTRVNIYATVRKNGWNWYLIGPGQWVEQRKVAMVDPSVMPVGAPETAEKWVAVDLYEQVMKVYEGQKLIAATLIASGLPPWHTNLGLFKVWQRAILTPMSGAMGQPDAYSLPAVPYVMFFDGEISLHGTYWHDGFGFKRSRGCVNLSISDAHWLYEWVGEDDLTVLVWDSGRVRS